jgi:hypothetical protein
MSWGWNDRPTKAEVKHHIGGDTPAVVYKVGRYEVTAPGDEIEITYRDPYHRQTDPRSTFPNMDVTDGEIRIPVTDLVDEILSRIEPVELAKALWQNEDVKAEFMACLTTRYNESGIGDGDRRKFLAEVKEAVHDKALDRLANTMAGLEFDMDRRANQYHQIGRINDTLRELDVKVSRGRKNDSGEWVTEPVLLQFNQLDTSTKNPEGGFTRGELEVAGKAWEESRAFWRTEVAKRFPTPVDDEDDGSSDLGLSDADLEVRP